VGVDVTHRRIATNGVELHVVEAGEGPLVVLCHGFPELWYSWRHQIPALAEAGYRVLAPDQRGYGGSDRPVDVAAYDILHLTDDLLGLLDALGEEQAVFVGHDWGAPVVWHLAQRVPQRVRGVAAMSVPFTPRPPVPPTDVWKRRYSDKFFYILYFQDVGPADAELGADPETALRRIYWTNSGDARPEAFKTNPKGSDYLDAMSEPPGGRLPGWLTADDLAYYAKEFSRTGFTGALNWYRNFDRNWELTEPLASTRVEVPAAYVVGERDSVLRMMRPEPMAEWVPGLREHVVLPGAGHWTQQERPAETNEVLLRFLASL
jgi:pimeloyl-ACP methyl ester carboxylesterase